MTNPTRITLADVCLPDYWPGSDVPYLQVAVTSTTTITQLREALLNELESMEGLSDTEYRQIRAAIKRLRLYPHGRYPFPDLPSDAEEVQAYFSIR